MLALSTHSFVLIYPTFFNTSSVNTSWGWDYEKFNIQLLVKVFDTIFEPNTVMDADESASTIEVGGGFLDLVGKKTSFRSVIK
jgi:hypothetical protein